MTRPTKHQLPPPPLYITNPLTPYCHTCGRVITSKSTTKPPTQEQKYCSARCRREKPGSLDGRIEECFLELLSGRAAGRALNVSVGRTDDAGKGYDEQIGAGKGKGSGKRRTEGGERVVAMCRAVEEVIFGERRALEKDERSDEAEFCAIDATAGNFVDHEAATGDEDASLPSENEHFRLPDDSSSGIASEAIADSQQLPGYGAGDYIARFSESEGESSVSEGSQAGIGAVENPELAGRRLRGHRLAQERETVRRAARRGVVFGFLSRDEGKKEKGETVAAGKLRKRKDKRAAEEIEKGGGGMKTKKRRKCEAVVNGIVVEPSFAKGDWGIRWRD